MSKLIQLNLDFMGKRRVAFALSLLLVVISLGSLFAQQLKFGLDFTGGTLVELTYEQAPSLDQVRNRLEQAGYEDIVVQNFGTERDVMVRLNQGFTSDVGQEVRDVLAQDTPDVHLQRAEFVGSQVGDELKEQGGIGMLVALAGVMLYVAFRFQYKFALGAVLSLAHDVIILLGVFSLFQLDFDLTVLAAVLAVIGYSLNDTIVVYDRIRENFRMTREGGPADLINLSINQTLSRTTITSLTTLMVLVALFLFGGEMIHNFALALIIGIGVGTYSSIYVAGTLLLRLNLQRQDMMLPVKEGAEDDGRP